MFLNASFSFPKKKLILVLLLITIQFYFTYQCNENICGSIVSKCMLTESCKCDPKNNSTCSRDCFFCLDQFFTECCTCVEMCPKPSTNVVLLANQSHVEDLPEPSAELFEALTSENDSLSRWKSFTFPVHVSFVVGGGNNVKQISFAHGTSVTINEGDGIDRVEDVHVNCTIAYITQCTSWNKCKLSCQSMGAVSYRWFHNGCCECVGLNCLNYGINEPRCLLCPPQKTKQSTTENVQQKNNKQQKVQNAEPAS